MKARTHPVDLILATSPLAGVFSSSRPSRSRRAAASVRRWVAATVGLFLLAGGARAQLASTVVMQGLENPRGLAFGPDGALYATEAGTPITTGASTPSLSVRGQTYYYGTTGAISRLAAGVQSRVLTALPMLFSPTSGEIAGAHGIGFNAAGDLYYTVGLGANPAQRTAAMTGLGLLMRLPAAGGAPQVVADISAFEGTNNPDGGAIDTNPYQLAVLSDRVVIADAGANDVVQTTFAGTTSLVSILPAMPAGGDAVPTGVAVGPDGALYATQLTSVPFPVGSAGIYRLGSSAPVKIAAGFTNAIDLKFGPDGLLYVLEITHNSLVSGSPTGGLWQVNPATGAGTLLMTDGLVRPTALAFDRTGNLYIADRGVIPGAGQVLRVAADQLAKTTQLLAARGLLNASTRGRTGPGADPLVLGFVVGTDAKQLLVRGVGPALGTFGIAAAADPKITVYDSAGRVVAENDNWSSGGATATAALTSAAAKTGAFALSSGSLDAALLVTLTPGAYTVQLGATAGAAGVALVEVYEVP